MPDADAWRHEEPVLPPRAHIVHQTGRRLRLKIPSRRHDGAFFERLERRLAAIPKIEAAVLTPETASALLTFAEGEGSGIAAALDALEILSVVRTPPNPAVPHREDPAARAAGNRTGASIPVPRAGARVDRRALAFTVLVLLLLRQLLRGGWLAPGLALLWFLFEVLRARFPEDGPAGSGGEIAAN